MHDFLYVEAYDKLNADIRQLVKKLMSDTAGKSRAYRDGVAEACEAFLRLASDSSGDLIIALDRQAEKEAEYFESDSTSDESAHEKQ